MRAVDTNVLVRLLTRDDAAQLAAAEAFVGPGAWVSHIVLVEACWVLTSVYQVEPKRIAAAVDLLLDHQHLAIQDAETGEQLMVDSSDPEFRRRLRRAGEERAVAVRDAARRAGVDLHVVSTDDDLVDAFVKIVESRKRLKR